MWNHEPRVSISDGVRDCRAVRRHQREPGGKRFQNYPRMALAPSDGKEKHPGRGNQAAFDIAVHWRKEFDRPVSSRGKRLQLALDFMARPLSGEHETRLRALP